MKKSTDRSFPIDSIDFPQARKFHSILPFRDDQVLMFGGAFFNLSQPNHTAVNDCLWTFNLKKFEWSLLPSIKLIQPIYFHAAAMNEVSLSIAPVSFDALLFSVEKSGRMEVSSISSVPTIILCA